MTWISGALLSVLLKKEAYLDPGSGSILIQLLIAGIAALTIAFGTQFSRIKRLFKKNKATTDEVDDEDKDEEHKPDA